MAVKVAKVARLILPDEADDMQYIVATMIEQAHGTAVKQGGVLLNLTVKIVVEQEFLSDGS